MIYHVLNGDALLDKFPSTLPGERVFMRECLVDGNVNGKTLEDFYHNRTQFLTTAYSNEEPFDYFEQTVREINRLINPVNQSPTQIYFWFEEDLFCQVNWWFSLFLVHQYQPQAQQFLVLPTTDLEYGFGGMQSEDLQHAFDKAQDLGHWKKLLVQLWPSYQERNYDQLLKLAQQLQPNFPFLIPAIQAEIDRQSTNGHPGKPEQLLKTIQSDLRTKEFGPVFKEFCKRGAIYGFGDLQVKRIWDSLSI